MPKVHLPRYTRVKQLKSASGYFWEPPTWARPPAERNGQVCPVQATPLGTDLAEAIARANVLNDAFDAWRNSKRASDIEMPRTVAWLFRWYREQENFTKNSAKTKNDYRKLMDAVCAVEMQRGTFGQRLASGVTATVSEALFKKFEDRGRRQAVYMVQVCRLVWNWANRFTDETGIPKGENPFAGMRKGYSAKGNRPTTRAEMLLYCETARKLGYESMATAALLSFELVRRVWDVFAIPNPREDPSRPHLDAEASGLLWEHYNPGISIRLKQSKPGEWLTIPLTFRHSTGEEVSLYPELEEQLARVTSDNASGAIVVEERNGKPYKHRRVSTVHREICEAAGLPKNMTFTGFRHGGATEMGDAGEADIRSISGHKQLNTSAIYNKASQEKARQIAIRRRAHIAKLMEGEGDLSE